MSSPTPSSHTSWGWSDLLEYPVILNDKFCVTYPLSMVSSWRPYSLSNDRCAPRDSFRGLRMPWLGAPILSRQYRLIAAKGGNLRQWQKNAVRDRNFYPMNRCAPWDSFRGLKLLSLVLRYYLVDSAKRGNLRQWQRHAVRYLKLLPNESLRFTGIFQRY